MLDSPLAPYLLWAKTRETAAFDLAGSNLLHCTIDELPGAREALDLTAANDAGYAPLIDGLAAHYGVEPRQVVTTPGCSGANFLVAAALIGAGDDVLIEAPTYDPLMGACRLMGARVLHFERRADAGWAVDAEAVRAALTPRTRLIVLTNPHNPSGTLVSPDAILAVGAIAAEARAHVLVDEVYLDGATMLSPGTRRTPAATLDGPFISTASLTKSYGLAGLRAGWAVTSLNTAERLRRTRDVVDNANSAPADLLAALAVRQLPALTARATRLLTTNVGLARTFFGAHPGLVLAGAIDSSIVFPRMAGTDDTAPFADALLREDGVAVVPGGLFGHPAHLRIGLGGETARLRTGLARLGARLAAWTPSP